jgi:hypothetical protein
MILAFLTMILAFLTMTNIRQFWVALLTISDN